MQGCVLGRLLLAIRALCRPPADCEGWRRALPAAPDLVASESEQWAGPSECSQQVASEMVTTKVEDSPSRGTQCEHPPCYDPCTLLYMVGVSGRL